jgi:periplasmic protein CpxP/Spy
MKKSLRSLILVAGIASMTALGCNFALADDSATTPAPTHTGGEHQHNCHKGKHQHGHRLLARLAKKLGLSDQQKVQVKAIFQDNHAQAKPTLDSLRAEKQQLRALIMSGSADEAAIRAQSAKVSAFQADLAVQRAKGAKQVLAVLTPDQQVKFKALQAQWGQKCGKSGRHHAAGPTE